MKPVFSSLQSCANIFSLLEKESLFLLLLWFIIYIRVSLQFDFQLTWWRLFRKRGVCTKFDIYVFIHYTIYNFIYKSRHWYVSFFGYRGSCCCCWLFCLPLLICNKNSRRQIAHLHTNVLQNIYLGFVILNMVLFTEFNSTWNKIC